MTLQKILPLFLLSIFFLACEDPKPIEEEVAVIAPEPARMKYGYDLNQYIVTESEIKSGDSFGKILDAQGATSEQIFKASEAMRDIFNIRGIQVGKSYMVLAAKDNPSTPAVFIYQRNNVDYLVVDMQGEDTQVKLDSFPVKYVQKVGSGVITSSLSQAMDEAGMGIKHAYELADIFRWSIDFFKLQQGDEFKLIYTDKYINDSTYAGLENIKAAVFYHQGQPYYGFEFEADTISRITDYYDEKGKTLRSFFLKAPVEYSRISSRFSPRRFHPVQKRWKAHKGTDYAAPRGTPIVSTANGTIIKAGYTRGNGRYVKVKHDSEFTTQYLHMSKILVKEGQRVKQGDVIGRVGSTGLATGPHVCYRFWRNGKQVDPYKQNLPAAEPLAPDALERYLACLGDVRQELDAVPLASQKANLNAQPESDQDASLEEASAAL